MRGKPLVQIEKLFWQQKCWTIEQLHQTLNYSIISVRGFLKQIGYFSSFTHNSKWYTLSSIPDFDNNGLWFHENIGFSKHGNFKESILYFINKSPKGLSAKQLAEILSTPCHAVLNHMYKSGAIDRFKYKTDFIYLSSASEKNKRQLVRLQSQFVDVSAPQKLSAQTAVYVLVEFIKQPEASFEELSKAVAKKQVIATPKAIARFFEEHDLKKTPH
jgi:hypothetical protein